MDDTTMNDCVKLRALESENPGWPAFRDHKEACEGCRAWATQMSAIDDAVSAMPQFDVPEALTQRIMQSVESQPAGANSWLLLAALSLLSVAAFVYLGLYSLDSPQGWIVSVISILSMAILKVFVQGIRTPVSDV